MKIFWARLLSAAKDKCLNSEDTLVFSEDDVEKAIDSLESPAMNTVYVQNILSQENQNSSLL